MANATLSTLGSLYMKYGCPHRMTIHVKGKDIVLIDGMPMADLDNKVTDIPCSECGQMLPVGRNKFCSTACYNRAGGKYKKNKAINRANDAVRVFDKLESKCSEAM